METFVSDRVGRTFILKLVQGEDLLESVERLIAEEGIENAVVVSGIATFDRSRLHMISTTGYPAEVFIDERCDVPTTGYPAEVFIDERCDVPLEVVSVEGFICDGEPHLHCTISDSRGAYAGHLLKGCRILYLGELVIQELLGLNLHRHLTEKGINHIYPKD